MRRLKDIPCSMEPWGLSTRPLCPVCQCRVLEPEDINSCELSCTMCGVKSIKEATLLLEAMTAVEYMDYRLKILNL